MTTSLRSDASIVLSEFENAAYIAQNSAPKGALLCSLNTSHDIRLSVADRRSPANQKTWEVFIRCLIETIGKEKFQWICRRYKFDAERMHREGRPLLAEHVELFSIGDAQQFTRDVKRLFPKDIKIKQLTRSQLQEKLVQAKAFHNVLGRYLDPRDINGGPSVFKARLVYDPLLMDREKQLLFSDVEHLTFSAFLERFCKAAVNRELQEGQIFPVPGSNGQLDYYRVYRKICTGHGLVAYALKPAAVDSTLNPLLVFRQTQVAPSHEDAFPSYLNDLQSVVGKWGYTPAKPFFDRLMNHSSFLAPGQMLDIAGYSLGGAHAQHFLADNHSRISTAHFYSDPSIDAQTADRFKKEIDASNRQENPLKISIYRTIGDICHWAGSKHVGCNADPNKVKIELIEINHENMKIAALSAHSYKALDNQQLDYSVRRIQDPTELSKELDNTKRGKKILWAERSRLVSGQILYVLFFLIYGILKVIGKIFDVNIPRSSQYRV